jgi:hypothetical protein
MRAEDLADLQAVVDGALDRAAKRAVAKRGKKKAEPKILSEQELKH